MKNFIKDVMAQGTIRVRKIPSTVGNQINSHSQVQECLKTCQSVQLVSSMKESSGREASGGED